MVKKRKGFKPNPHPTCYYPLTEVNDKVTRGRVLIRQNAIERALQDFGWLTDDILKVYKKLGPSNFHKTENSKTKTLVILDFYKGHINGEDIYTHFYIDDEIDMLVINSFHKDEEN